MLVLDSLFEMINRGVTESKDDFHTMVFSNFQNSKVESRCVILRNFDREQKLLIFNTDIRSPKVAAIRKNPETQCLFYSFREKTQLRISTESTVHYNDDLHRIGWNKTAVSSRKCYLTKYKPSQYIETMDDGIPNHLIGRIPTSDESQPGKINFAVISNRIISIDWLYLSSKGHNRARYDFNNGSIKKSWLAP